MRIYTFTEKFFDQSLGGIIVEAITRKYRSKVAIIITNKLVRHKEKSVLGPVSDFQSSVHSDE